LKKNQTNLKHLTHGKNQMYIADSLASGQQSGCSGIRPTDLWHQTKIPTELMPWHQANRSTEWMLWHQANRHTEWMFWHQANRRTGPQAYRVDALAAIATLR